MYEQILEEAAEILQTHGWIQFQQEKDDHFCALGAIYHATQHLNLPYPLLQDARIETYRVLAEVIREQYPDWYQAELEDDIQELGDWKLKDTVVVAQFNDRSEANLAEVIAMFEKAARR